MEYSTRSTRWVRSTPIRADSQEVDRAYLLRVSYLEIYNETLRDLLTDKKGPLKPQDQPVIHTGNVSGLSSPSTWLTRRARFTSNRS